MSSYLKGFIFKLFDYFVIVYGEEKPSMSIVEENPQYDENKS